MFPPQPVAKRACPALDWIPSHGDKDHQLPLEESTHVARRAVLGEVYIWKRTLIWAGGSLALSGPCSPAWLQGRWAVESPPYQTWLSPRKREGLCPHTTLCLGSPYSVDLTGLHVTASCNGKRSGLFFQVRGEQRHGPTWTGQILAMAEGRGGA